MPNGSIDDLKKVIALRDLPEAHLQWILERSIYEELEEGTAVIKTGETIDYMYMVIEGKNDFYMDVNGKLVYYFSFLNDEQTGGISGMIPYSRMKTSPGIAFATRKCRLFRLHKDHFQDLEQLNPEFIQKLIGYMTERARSFATQKLQYEKVNALGQLAAGIAHELNNPAAAINRISAELNKRILQQYELTEKLLHNHVDSTLIKKLQQLADAKRCDAAKTRLSPLQRIEKEDALFDWLEENGIHDNRELAETLSESGFSAEDLRAIHTDADPDAFGLLLNWFENLLSSQKITKDLDDASCRISNLVTAIKSHVHMDRTNALQPTNVQKDIENTLTLLGYKLREKQISIKKDFCSDMRVVPAYVGELNQVWTNLIDNAIYAMDKNGELTIETKCNKKEVQVYIVDNGGGISPDIVSRIFDPFFTTKKVGEGTGIGLDLVMRIVKRHNGDIQVNSVPGRTEFRVCIPFVPEEQHTLNEKAAAL